MAVEQMHPVEMLERRIILLETSFHLVIVALQQVELEREELRQEIGRRHEEAIRNPKIIVPH